MNDELKEYLDHITSFANTGGEQSRSKQLKIAEMLKELRNLINKHDVTSQPDLGGC